MLPSAARPKRKRKKTPHFFASFTLRLGFLRDKPRNATVRALVPCRCAAIEGDVFRVLIGEGTALRKRLLLEAQTYVNGMF